MAEKIEIHPGFRTPAFFATENITIEFPGFLYISDGYCQMKRLDCLQYWSPYTAFTLRGITSSWGSRSSATLKYARWPNPRHPSSLFIYYISPITRPNSSTWFQFVNSIFVSGSVGPLVIHIINLIIKRSRNLYFL